VKDAPAPATGETRVPVDSAEMSELAWRISAAGILIVGLSCGFTICHSFPCTTMKA